MVLAGLAFAGACFFLLAPWQFNRNAERTAQKIPDVPEDTALIPIKKVGIIGAGLAGFWTRLVYGLIIIISVSVHALALKTQRE